MGVSGEGRGRSDSPRECAEDKGAAESVAAEPCLWEEARSDQPTFSVLLDNVDGGQEKFEVEVQIDDVPVVSKLDQMMKAGVLGVATGGAAMVADTTGGHATRGVSQYACRHWRMQPHHVCRRRTQRPESERRRRNRESQAVRASSPPTIGASWRRPLSDKQVFSVRADTALRGFVLCSAYTRQGKPTNRDGKWPTITPVASLRCDGRTPHRAQPDRRASAERSSTLESGRVAGPGPARPACRMGVPMASGEVW